MDHDDTLPVDNTGSVENAVAVIQDKDKATLAPMMDRLLELFGQGERDLLGFFLIEFIEMLLQGGDQVVPILEFSAQGAMRNVHRDSDAVWAYLRLADVALAHGFIEKQDDRLRIERHLRQIGSWANGLANGAGKVSNGNRHWSEVARFAEHLCDSLPGRGVRQVVEAA